MRKSDDLVDRQCSASFAAKSRTQIARTNMTPHRSLNEAPRLSSKPPRMPAQAIPPSIGAAMFDFTRTELGSSGNPSRNMTSPYDASPAIMEALVDAAERQWPVHPRIKIAAAARASP